MDGTIDKNPGDTNNFSQVVFGKANTVDGELITSTAGINKLTKVSDTMTRAANFSSILKGPVTTGSPGSPSLSPPGNYNAAEVAGEMKANPWFGSTFLVSITRNMMSIVDIQGKIQEAEMELVVLQMNNTITLAHNTGDLILAAAEKEAKMYMAMAIASLVSLGVGCVGAAMSGVGKFKGAMKGIEAKQMKSGMKEKVPEKTNAEGRTGPDGIGNDAKTKQTQTTKEAKQLDKDATLANEKTDGKNTGRVETKTDMEKWKELKKSEARYGALGDAGTLLVQSNTSLNNILTNFIQMVFKPEIAALERARTLSEASQKIAASSLEYASQAFSTASQAIDAALQLLQKIQDETARANDMKG